MCLKIYHLYPAKYLSAPGLAWQAALEKTDVKLEVLIDMQKLIINTIKLKNHHILNIGTK